MKEFLPLFTHPSNYLGIEINSIHKSKDTPIKWCLAFPDKYPVGASYFGHQILYHILNSKDYIWAQRVYGPSLDVGRILKEKDIPLTTLEGDMCLLDMDIIGFSITHELCYTTVLYMLDLAKIPFYSKDRGNSHPIIIAGGEGVFNPAPMEPFIDVFVIGDGEEVVLEISEVIMDHKSYSDKDKREDILKSLFSIEGIYIPQMGKKEVKRRIYFDFKEGDIPIKQIIPFGKPVHDRYVVEISKGCTRGCRFCFAGMINRPVRERNVDLVGSILDRGLDLTGYEDIGLLSLSVGDFSRLDKLIPDVFSRCIERNVSLSLPSLRAGSIPENIIHYLGRLKKRGLTLAPEAGTERLRKVINKGISEEDILNHAKWAFENGWQQIKLYFMMGLPTETREDLDGIVDLCVKISRLSPQKKRLKVSASISPFVPKPHTPFQWERQNSLEEIQEKIRYLKNLFKKYRFLHLSWPVLEMSIVEGVFSRGDNKLSRAILEGYLSGDVFTSWKEHFNYSIWDDVFKRLNIDISNYTGARDFEDSLPWDFINIGVMKKFLKKELSLAKEGKPTEDCRWGKCVGCGVCDFKSIYPKINSSEKLDNILNLEGIKKDNLGDEKYAYLFWFEKTSLASYLSQLELQKIIERIMRRAGLSFVFSKGFSPRPKISFGRALPVGVWSMCEYVIVQVTKELDLDVIGVLNKMSIDGIRFTSLEFRSKDFTIPYSKRELYEVLFLKNQARYIESLKDMDLNSLSVSKKDEVISIEDLISEWKLEENSLYIMFDWSKTYLNPLSLVRKILNGAELSEFRLIKHKQFFD